MTQNLNAANNPTLANNLIDKVLAEPEVQIEKANIQYPADNLVTLPGGYISATGEVIKTVEVRELNGRDEELITKTSNIGRLFSTILSRGTVSVGALKADENILDNLLAGDRDAVLLGIYKATFGSTTELESFCQGCQDYKTVEVDIDRDIKSKVLVDPVKDRVFTVYGKSHEYTVILPNGATQRELSSNLDKTLSELNTMLLEQTVVEIDGNPVVSKNQVQNIGIADRRKISEELTKRTPGPQFETVTITCPDCEGEVVVPINLGTLFRF
ncbi:hypothetical protein UFOVP46_25 [uncultured Caudovirales phage]|uniref:Baseplate hub assembly protein, bacteriophage T4-like n=1 Tax=uncultured Caudovirales phage TaxID=2100421 RepID=A0A6J5KRK9_9CAUD|nr:hypothetical protein UFOVP46_25 [uncultured Caudovirales phage]